MYIYKMSAPQIVKAKELNVKNISYSEPKSLQNGGKAVYVNYDGKPLILQTPKMRCPFGMSVYEDGEYPKYSLPLSFSGMDGNESLNKFHEVLENFDKKLLKDGVKNSMLWFKKKKQSLEVCKALYSPQIKQSLDENGEPNGKYPDTIKVKLPWRDDKFLCDAYDSNRELIEGDLKKVLVKGSQVQALIQCVGLWFAGGKYGCSWKVVQMKITPAAGVSGYSFLSDSDEDEDGAEEEDEEQELLVESDED